MLYSPSERSAIAAVPQWRVWACRAQDAESSGMRIDCINGSYRAEYVVWLLDFEARVWFWARPARKNFCGREKVFFVTGFFVAQPPFLHQNAYFRTLVLCTTIELCDGTHAIMCAVMWAARPCQ